MVVCLETPRRHESKIPGLFFLSVLCCREDTGLGKGSSGFLSQMMPKVT